MELVQRNDRLLTILNQSPVQRNYGLPVVEKLVQRSDRLPNLVLTSVTQKRRSRQILSKKGFYCEAMYFGYETLGVLKPLLVTIRGVAEPSYLTNTVGLLNYSK